MVLIHGVGLRSEAWARMLPGLKDNFSITILDLPGHGASSCFTHAPSLANYTDIIAEALSTLDASSFVVGHSMGALLAMDLAVKYPDLVSAIAPLNAIFRRSEKAKIAVADRVEEIKSCGVTDPDGTLARWFGENPTGDTKIASDECRDWLTSVNPIGYRHAYSVFAREDGPSSEDLGSIKCPSLFVTGSQEPNSTPEMSKMLADQVAQGRVEIVENAKHMMPMTHAETVVKHLTSFYREYEASHGNV